MDQTMPSDSRQPTVPGMFATLMGEIVSLRRQNENQQRQLEQLQGDMCLLLERSNNTTQVSTMPQFRHLPLEVREMIWELAVPSRLLRFVDATKRSVVSSALAVPTVAHVCRESRRVVLTRKPVTNLSGGSHHFGGAGHLWRLSHYENSRPACWTWFTPYRDALLIDPNALSEIRMKESRSILRIAEHIIVRDCGIWKDFSRLEGGREEDEEKTLRRLCRWWRDVLPDLEEPFPPAGRACTLRTVDFAMNSVTKIDRIYPPSFVQGLFAGECVKTVDLRDEDAVRGIEKMLVDEISQSMPRDRFLRSRDGLQKSLDIFKAANSTLFKHVRASLLKDMVLHFQPYYHDIRRRGPRKSGPGTASPIDPEGEPDMDIRWVKECTERLNIRPVHVFVRVDGMYI